MYLIEIVAFHQLLKRQNCCSHNYNTYASKPLHNGSPKQKILLGDVSKSSITVEPVVVIPDILSKNASLKERFKLDKHKRNTSKKSDTNPGQGRKQKMLVEDLIVFSFVKLVKTIKFQLL